MSEAILLVSGSSGLQAQEPGSGIWAHLWYAVASTPNPNFVDI